MAPTPDYSKGEQVTVDSSTGVTFALMVNQLSFAYRARAAQILCSLGLCASHALAQAPQATVPEPLSNPTIHWAYADFFGSGWYRLSEQQNALIVGYNPEIRSKTYLDGRAVATLSAPMTLGLSNFQLDDVPGALEPDNLAAVSAGLGMDVDIKLSERLSIRPYAHLGYGTLLGESNDTWTYRADIRSRYRYTLFGVDVDVLASVGTVGYTTNRGPNDRFTFGSAGLEYSHRLTLFDPDGRLHWHVNYSNFFDDIVLQTSTGVSERTTDAWEAGFAYGLVNRDLKIWRFSFDRLGIALARSGSSELAGIRLVFNSHYEP